MDSKRKTRTSFVPENIRRRSRLSTIRQPDIIDDRLRPAISKKSLAPVQSSIHHQKPQHCSRGSKSSKASARMLQAVESSMTQRTDMNKTFVRASLMVTSKRLGEINKDKSPPGSAYNKTRAKSTDPETLGSENLAFVPQRKLRRQELPFKPKRSASLWPVIRNCIGKDISTVTIPVAFSEPLTMLQRLAEEFQYSHLLDRAAASVDPLEQLAFVSAFVVSAYGPSANRLTKPFIPLLGETYELDRRDDLGWRFISEQIIHTPSTSVQYCESLRWKCWKTFSVATLFRGKYMKVIPSGMSHLSLNKGNLFSWNRVEGTINNILVGKMWLDNVGEVQVVNHSNGNHCTLQFLQSDPQNKDYQKRVNGSLVDKGGKLRWVMEGKWDSYIQITPVRQIKDHTEPVGPTETIWRCDEPPIQTSVYYNFNLFACQLNEQENLIAPTDSRLRSDVRLMEAGSWDEADSLKRKLEQRDREEQKKGLENNPVWFTPALNPISHLSFYQFTGGYWRAKAIGDWSKCPNIVKC